MSSLSSRNKLPEQLNITQKQMPKFLGTVQFCLFLYFVRSSRPEVFLRKDVRKVCSKLKAEHACRSEVSIKLQSNLRTPLDGCFCFVSIIFSTIVYFKTYISEVNIKIFPHQVRNGFQKAKVLAHW